MLNLIAQVPHSISGDSGGIQGVGAFVPKTEQMSDAPAQITNLISTVVGGVTIIAGLLFLFYFLIASIQWITAGGNTQQLENARDRITNSIIGLIVTIAAYAIVALVGSVFGLDILNPVLLISKISVGGQ